MFQQKIQLLGSIIFIIGFFATVCQGVKITNLKVPSPYAIGEAGDDLLLDCEYEIEPEETGFVLKWLFNESSIYQWIPGHKPYALSFMKGRVDLGYVASKDKFYRHRSLLVTRPTWNMTGTFTCHVQTFQSSDKRSASLQIIVPERDFQLNHKVDEQGIVNIRCSATDIYPEPQIAILLGDDDQRTDLRDIQSTRDESGLYDNSVERKLPKEDLESPTAINCILSIPGTNYTKKRETIFYDHVPTTQSTSTIDPDDMDNLSAKSKNVSENANSANTQMNTSVTTTTIGLLSSLLIIWCTGSLQLRNN